jgi:nitrate reductase assembly molybdenum cofactor insertion protein NarJ
MRRSTAHYDAWAGLLAYPDERGIDAARGGLAHLRAAGAPHARELAALAAFLERAPGEREELYTRTFDGCDDRALELGWHLHGENYARGALLVRFRQLLQELELIEHGELPDHLGVVLGVLGRLDAERADALARGVVLPAVRRLSENLDAANPYRCVIDGVLAFLVRQHAERGETA